MPQDHIGELDPAQRPSRMNSMPTPNSKLATLLAVGALTGPPVGAVALGYNAAPAIANDDRPLTFDFNTGTVDSCQTDAISKGVFVKDQANIYKKGSKVVKTSFKLADLEYWTGNEFQYDCDAVTKNTVSVSLLRRVKAKGGKKARIATSNLRIYTADDGPGYDGVQGGLTKFTDTIKLPKKLSATNLKKKTYGVQVVVKSEQRPGAKVVDDNGNPASVPAKTVTYNTWLTPAAKKKATKRK